MWHSLLVVLDATYAKFCLMPMFFGIGFLLEKIAPAGDPRTRRGMVLNVANGFFLRMCEVLASLFLARLLLGWRAPISLFPKDHGSLALALGLAMMWMILYDFFYYWLHRVQHASKWLWAEHMLHHSDEQLNVTTSLRHHWLEMPLNALCVTAPLVLLFRPPLITVPLAYLATSFVGYFIHMNVRLNLGRWSWLIAAPQTHRIHHSRLPQHLDKNFAQFFLLWDVIFGTFYNPSKDEYPPSGLTSGEQVTSLDRALKLPFAEWRRMLS